MHDRTVEEVFKLLDTSTDGLSDEEAELRLNTLGPNTLEEEGRRRPPLFIFLKQFKDLMILILLAAAIIAGLTGDLADAVVILAIVVLNGILGFTQEYRAEQALTALRKMDVHRVSVTRNSERREIPTQDLVPGDLIHLSAGSRIPADGRLITAINLQIDEASLTGESNPVMKQTGPTPSNAPLMDRKNIVYRGTAVASGRGEAIVMATGMRTEMGRIAHLLQTTEKEKTPLQIRLANVGRWLVLAVLLICGIIFFAGLWRGESPAVMFLTAISLAVAAIPEGLPAVVAIVLAIGSQRMAARRALIRKLPTVETLGCVTVICSDKTGTLTENRMTMTQIYIPGPGKRDSEGHPPSPIPMRDRLPDLPKDLSLRPLLETMALCNDAVSQESSHSGQDPSHSLHGDPMEQALLDAAGSAGIYKADLEVLYPRISEIPFDPTRKRMVTLHKTESGFRLLMKGGIDEVLQCSDRLLSGPSILALSEEIRTKILEANRQMAADGLRILAAAYQDLDREPHDLRDVEKGMTFLGLAGMMDPPRREVREAVRKCLQAGILPIMITGDHRLTAEAVARDLGISHEDSRTITLSEDTSAFDDPSLQNGLDRVTVYARVIPEHKLRIVEAYQRQGQIVAMTGDGVNDAPALKRAHVGVAMGITGTDVTKEAADMILLDDNFATIVSAIEEGRRIYDNIRKFIRYMLTTNFGEILVLLFAILLGMPLPLLPVQILWINLVTDGLPALALGMEPAERGIMKRPPRPPAESLFSRGLGWHILWVGFLMSTGTLAVFSWSLTTHSLAYAQTLVFYTLVMFQLFHVLAIRSERNSLFQQGILSNPYLLASVILGILLQLALITVPDLREVFHTILPQSEDLLICTAVAFSVFLLVELEKWLVRRGVLWKT